MQRVIYGRITVVDVPRSLHYERRVGFFARAFESAHITAEPVERIADRVGACDIQNTLVSVCEQMRDDFFRTLSVAVQKRMIFEPPHFSSRKHERYRKLRIQFTKRIVVVQRHADDPVDASALQRPERRAFVFDLFFRVHQ